MKVLFIVLGLEFSGAEKVLMEYVKDNHEIDPYFLTIYTGTAFNKFSERFKEKSFCANVNYSKNALRFCPGIAQREFYKKSQDIISNINPDIIYINNTLEIALSKKICQKYNCKFVAHIHDMKQSIRSFVKRMEIRKTVKYLNHIFTVSEACKKSWDIENIEVVYNGVDKKYFALNRQEHDGMTIGYVGMISHRKGFDYLVQLIRQLDNHISWKIAYNIVESGYESYLEEIKNIENITVYQNLSSDEMLDFYDNIDILLIPSRQDPLPTVAIEAMAKGVLVLGNNTGGIPELVGDKEYLFENDNLEELINKINLFTKDEIVEKSRKQRACVIRIFDINEKRKKVNTTLSQIV